MPRYSRFYSATEAAATTSFPQLCPRRNDVPHFNSDDAKQLAGILAGTLTAYPRQRSDVNQPLFRPNPGLQSVQELLLNARGFSIAHETVHRSKFVRHDSTSEESAQEWKTRSRTPSSDEMSPRKVRIATSTLSTRATTSSNESDDDLTPMAKHTLMNQVNDWVSFPNHYASYPDNVLQNMDMQFSTWSHDLNEGTTAVPFVMAQAPPDTHESLVKVDQEFWFMKDESTDKETTKCQSAAKAVLERARKKTLKPLNTTKPARVLKLKDPNSEGISSKFDSSSKRAALIARSKAAKDSSLVLSKTAGQRRSEKYKNKNRRSIMPSPPPTARKALLVKNLEAQIEESRPTVLILDRKDDDQRRVLDSALQNETLDWGNDRHMDLLMERLRGTGADKDEERGRVVGEVDVGNSALVMSFADIFRRPCKWVRPRDLRERRGRRQRTVPRNRSSLIA